MLTPPCPLPDEGTALVVMRPEEGRRLIGLAVAALPQVKRAAHQGRMVIVGGSTTRHAAHALTGNDPGRDAFAVGWIRDGLLGESPKPGRGEGPFLFENGQVTRGWPAPLLERFQAGDVYVKGANAMDADGHVGILMASPTGGTIGLAVAILHARGGELVIPVSLGKLIPSVPAVLPCLGQGKVGRVMGAPVGMMPIPVGSATVVTEITAFEVLFGVRATPVAAGGLDDCAGALVLHLAGPAAAVDLAWHALETARQQAMAETH